MARSNLQIKVGTYTGDGVDGTNITGVGFRPDLVIVKGGANFAVFRTKEMTGDATGYLGTNIALLADAIQEILNDGFQVGTHATVNAAATTYYYIAIRGTAGQNYFRTGKYTGSGVDARDFTTGGLGFIPDYVAISADAAQNKVFRTSTMSGDSTGNFGGAINIANAVQNLQLNGFQLGTAGQVNTSAGAYYFFALKELAGVIDVATFVGDATDNRNITGIGFQPDVIFIKSADTTGQARMKTSDLAGDAALPFGAAASGTNWLQSISSDGFQVGSSANGNTENYHILCLKAGSFNAPIVRTAA